MRKVLLALGAFAVLLVVAGTLIYTVPPLRDEAEWRWAAFQDGEQDYAVYLRERPHGRHAGAARRRLDDKVWERAEAADTIAALNGYLKAYSQGRHARAAVGRIDALRWNTARAANTIVSYRTYLRISADGAHVTEARKRFRELRWKRTAAQIATLACAGVSSRRAQLYRAPSLISRLDLPNGNPLYISYIVSISGAPGKGYRELAKSPCKGLDVLGTAKYTVFDASSQPRGKWAFVALRQKPSVRGWVYIANAFNTSGASRVEWPLAPLVPADTLLAKSNGLPDLAFGAHTQAYHTGESCEGKGDVNVWDLVVRNEGQGAAPSTARLRISPGVPLYVNGRAVDQTRVVTFRFARPWLPGESIVVRGVPFQARVELDPGGAVRESNEGNNSLSLYQPGFILTCG